MAIRLGKDQHGGYIESIGGKSIRLNPNSSTVGLFVSESGRVGIGTSVSEPVATLQVKGSVKADEIDTGDIVFRKAGRPLWRVYEEDSGLYLENLRSGSSSRIFLEHDLDDLRSELAALRAQVEALE